MKIGLLVKHKFSKWQFNSSWTYWLCGNVESGNSASAYCFFKTTLGGSATVSGMTYTQRPNCADGTVDIITKV